MFLIVLSKLAGTAVGGAVISWGRLEPLLGLAIVGILPIWFEALASAFTGVEPGREYRLHWRLLDLVADGVTFIGAPAIGFCWLLRSGLGTGLFIALSIFAVCAGFRLARFFWRGLLHDSWYEGLPVTYTGYIWWIVYACADKDRITIAIIILLLEAVAMVSPWIRIPAGGGRAPMERRESARS